MIRTVSNRRFSELRRRKSMEMNKSSELVNVTRIATETEPPGDSKSNSIEYLLDQADQAIQMGNVQESRDHLTRIFEHLASSPANTVSIQSDSHYRTEAYQMRRSA
jgi:hypothetical protein